MRMPSSPAPSLLLTPASRRRPAGPRRAVALALSLFAAASLSACAHLPWAKGSGGSCRELWSDRPDREVQYELARDAKVTPRGNEGYADYRQRVARSTCRMRWSVLVFIEDASAGGEARAAQLFGELEAPFAESWRSAASTLDADVLAEVALPSGGRRLHLMRGPGAKGERTQLAELVSPIVELVPSEAGDAGAKLERFVRWAVAAYPAEEHLLVLPGPSPALADAARGLARATAANGGHPFAIVLAGTPGAQSAESAVELAPAARFLVGGESAVGIAGVSARALIPYLNGTVQKASGEAVSARSLAALFPRLVREAVGEGGAEAPIAGAREGYAVSAVDALAVDRGLVAALDRLARALLGYVAEVELRKIDLAYAIGPNGPPVGPGGRRDLGALLAHLDLALDREEEKTDGPAFLEARAAIAAARAAVGETVVERRFGAANAPETTGLAIWVPEDRAGLAAGAEAFGATRLAARLGATPAQPDVWRTWLDAVLP